MANFRHIARILSGKTEDEMRAQMSEISGHARLSLQVTAGSASILWWNRGAAAASWGGGEKFEILNKIDK